MAREFKTGTWQGGEYRSEVSGRFRGRTAGGQEVSVPYPEAKYWGADVDAKVLAGETICILVDASGNMILDASGKAILCP